MEHREAQNETVEDACPEKVKKLFGLLNEHGSDPVPWI